MKTDFYFQLRHGDVRKYESKMSAMHIMAAILLMVYLIFLLPSWDDSWAEIVSIGPALLAIVYFSIFRKDMLRQDGVNRIFRLFEMGFLFIAGLFFLELPQIWAAGLYFIAAAVMLFLLIVEHKIFGGQFIELKEDVIHIPNLFSTQKIKWEELESIVLKHKVITFEKKNNQFLQKDVHHLYNEIELSQFKEFCVHKLGK